MMTVFIKTGLTLLLVASGILCRDGADPSGCSALYPKCTEGRNQSPVDIREENVVHRDMGPIVLHNYNTQSLGIRAWNYGEYAIIEIRRGKAYISGANLQDNKYELTQFHFHWGNDSNRGSEHTYEGRPYPAELHFIHYNLKYSSLQEAVNKEPDGVAALVVFIEVAEEDNLAFTEVFDGISKVRKAGSRHSIAPIRLDRLLPSNMDSYYAYHGSLSSPAFQESVQWLLLKSPIYLSENQLTQLRMLEDKNGRLGANTARETQPLNGRTVYYNDRTGVKTQPHQEF